LIPCFAVLHLWLTTCLRHRSDPGHTVLKFFAERTPVVSRGAYCNAKVRRKNYGSLGHVRHDLFGAKEAKHRGRRRGKKSGPNRKWDRAFEKKVRNEALTIYAFKTELAEGRSGTAKSSPLQGTMTRASLSV
jgi:hypothetical protein